jgi:hypothetical protein
VKKATSNPAGYDVRGIAADLKRWRRDRHATGGWKRQSLFGKYKLPPTK